MPSTSPEVPAATAAGETLASRSASVTFEGSSPGICNKYRLPQQAHHNQARFADIPPASGGNFLARRSLRRVYFRKTFVSLSFVDTRINSWPFTFEFVSLNMNTGLPTGTYTFIFE